MKYRLNDVRMICTKAGPEGEKKKLETHFRAPVRHHSASGSELVATLGYTHHHRTWGASGCRVEDSRSPIVARR